MMNITLGILSILLVGHLPTTTANGTAYPEATPQDDDSSKHTLKHCLQTLTALHDTAHQAQQSREKPRRLRPEVGDTERTRIPNIRVKHRMMKALGWTYDADEKSDDEAWRRMNLDY